MALIIENIERKKKLLGESYTLIERLKKVRALNADPRLVGIDPRLQQVESSYVIVKTSKI